MSEVFLHGNIGVMLAQIVRSSAIHRRGDLAVAEMWNDKGFTFEKRIMYIYSWFELEWSSGYGRPSLTNTCKRKTPGVCQLWGDAV